MFDAEMMSQLTALLTVIGIDIVLAGDNAVVVGMAAAGLPKELRAKAIMIGIIAAMVMRIGFSVVAAEMMGISDTRGILAPGLAADIVAMPNNPLDSTAALHEINWVMQNGELVRHP